VLHLGFILLLLGVSFKLNLASFWGCLRLILHVFICFIGSIKPFRMWLGKLLVYPLPKFFKIRWTNQHAYFSFCYHVGVCAVLEEVIQVSKRFLPTLRGLWWMIGFLFNRSPFMPHVLCVPYHNRSLRLATKVRVCKGAGQKWSSRVTFHILGSVGECEGMNPHTPKWVPTLGVKVLMNS
jgi:hypothetical protein